MPQAFAPVRPAAPTIASNDAATTPTDLIQLHLAACNALAQALHTLRTSDCTAQDLARAIGRARRGLTNLKRMAAVEGVAA